MKKVSKNFNYSFKWIFCLSFLVVFLLLIFCPITDEIITTKALTVLFISFFPWFGKYVKSIETMGTKIELISPEEKKAVDKIFEESNVNITSKKSNIIKYIEQKDENNSIKRVAYIVLEIEKSLNELAKANKISEQYPNKNLGLLLFNKGILNEQEYILLKSIFPTLIKIINSSSESLKINELDWLLEKGKYILNFLCLKIEEEKK